MDEYIPSLSPEERAQLRERREVARRARRRARRRERIRHLLPVAAVFVLLCGAALSYTIAQAKKAESAIMPEQPVFSSKLPPVPVVSNEPFSAHTTDDTLTITDGIESRYAIVLDVDSGAVLAQKEADAIISPASMTKVLTILAAAEALSEEQLSGSVTMTLEIADYCYVNDCSVVGFEVGETIPVKELFYGTILSSGADAALCLAEYVSGSHEAFVALMNEKLDQLGLSKTAHFTNCVGLYDEAHKCTVSDMALIMKAAMDNALCREVLYARTFETSPTPEHPKGQVLSNLFLRRIEDRDNGGLTIVGAKTGFVNQSGNCAVSCGSDENGKLYIVATGNAQGASACMADHTALYHDYCAPLVQSPQTSS